MKQKLLDLQKQAKQELGKVSDLSALKDFQTKYLGRKEGQLNLLLKGLKNLSNKQKKEVGPLANKVKQELTVLIEQKEGEFGEAEVSAQLNQDWIDTTLPVERGAKGHFNPQTIVQNELEDLFKSFGFQILDGPELETDYYNFEALNIPESHPARDAQDTFYIDGKKDWVMRTHTSPVQIRALEKFGAPLRAIVPGRAFRNEATDASHDHTFYQLEGLVVDENISIANLIAVMKALLKGVFKKDVKIRLRPGHFPFVEPGFELDINCLICQGKGCSVCKQTGWLELLPCGMVHPNVLKAGGIDPKKYSGFAFGLGMTRLVMMKYGINDIRVFHSGDLRFVEQF